MRIVIILFCQKHKRIQLTKILSHTKEKALTEINPHLFTIATLTYHARLAYGPYTAVMDNGPARKVNFAQKLQETGNLFGVMFEVSMVRKEDFDFIEDTSGDFVDILQTNNKPSSKTPRGHQFPAAFLQKVKLIMMNLWIWRLHLHLVKDIVIQWEQHQQ